MNVMRQQLQVSIGQHSDKGRKAINQDSIGAYIPKEPLLSTKGIAIAVADGISSSNVSQIASETAVNGFLQDYFCTSDAWSVKTSAERVLQATNSWLFSQTRSSPHRFNKDKGYICTFSALIIKSNSAHLFHSGDTRIFRLIDNDLEQLTEDHRHQLDEETSYLTRALGIHQTLDMDYQTLSVEEGDVFVLASDGVYEHVSASGIVQAFNENRSDLDRAARSITQQAFDAASGDNLSVQIVKIDQLPDHQIDELFHQVSTLPLPPKLQARMQFDGYNIEREIYISSRSHVYLGVDELSKQKVVIKTPSTEMRDNAAYLERFLMEDWIAKRIDNAHVLKATAISRKRNYLYLATEYIEGQTLTQWMRDNPRPSVEVVRDIAEQVAKGLQAFHRQEMIHQDLRPANVMIDHNGTVKIIDFGSTKVAGIAEIQASEQIQGTAQYTAPEYFIGQGGAPRSDVFSLGVMCYQMLTGTLPYGTKVSTARTPSAQNKLQYTPINHKRKDIPDWVDDAIKKSVHVTPLKRYQVMSEFVYDLRHPNTSFLNKTRPPLIDRNPVAFWQGVSFIFLLIIVCLLIWR
ncbi:bifunctional protein-serine/threonine kinase/phosphatase [Teredinibacter haidensis]|uniref:bifunctional protein-serine/threonine kinase/phosphatase n=1 Tax=Teredinibacter haidensis TaxID=2731755 RepID=UPI001FE37315|nr:bifunctional protein-serine/threonine kinase/phosphatase [Teredinibacter haidensis]